jgi:hypothetical protein
VILSYFSGSRYPGVIGAEDKVKSVALPTLGDN